MPIDRVCQMFHIIYCDLVYEPMKLIIKVTDLVSQEFCGPLYSSNTSLGSAVSSAIASATSIAIAATAGKDGTDLSSYPLCAVCYPLLEWVRTISGQCADSFYFIHSNLV